MFFSKTIKLNFPQVFIYLSYSFSWSKTLFKNRKFWLYYFLRKFVLAKLANFKVGEICELQNMTFTVFIFITATSEYSCQQHFSRTSTIWFLLMLLICFIHTIEYKPDEHHCNSVLWSILGLLIPKKSYFRLIFA